MAKILLRAPNGRMLFEDPGDLVYQEEGGACCIAECQDEYYSTINIASGTCSGDCSNIAGQTVTRIGETCQWTAVQGDWTHESGCDPVDGLWRYKVWSGGIGGTLCASWLWIGAGTPTCPPEGGTEAGTFIRDGGACTPEGDAGPNEFALAATGPYVPSLICASGTEPSMVLIITAPDGDLPLSWCGKTWVKSTETPGTNEAYSGQPQEVCPFQYTKGVTSGSLTVNHIHRWFNNNGAQLEMFRRYLSYKSTFSTFYTNVNFLALPGLGLTVKDVFAKSWKTTYATATVIDSTFNIGLISAEPLPQKTAYTLTNAFFGSYATGNVTYAWSRGTNW